MATPSPPSGPGPVPVHWGGVRCRGDEDSLLLCEKDAWRGGACPPGAAAAVRCSFSPGEKTRVLVCRPRVRSRAAGGRSAQGDGSLPEGAGPGTPESARPSAVALQSSQPCVWQPEAHPTSLSAFSVSSSLLTEPSRTEHKQEMYTFPHHFFYIFQAF